MPDMIGFMSGIFVEYVSYASFYRYLIKYLFTDGGVIG